MDKTREEKPSAPKVGKPAPGKTQAEEWGERRPGFTGRPETELRTSASTLTGVAASLIEKVDLPRNRPAHIVEFIDDLTGQHMSLEALRRALLGE